MENNLLQIIDANLNRTREGLRVCEDIARFSLRNKNATKTLKAIRHSATDMVLKSKKISFREILANRNVTEDRVKFADLMPGPGIEIADIFMSNMQRVKESLRVLEECFKIIDEKISRGYRKLRFNTYDAEKRIVKKIVFSDNHRT